MGSSSHFICSVNIGCDLGEAVLGNSCLLQKFKGAKRAPLLV